MKLLQKRWKVSVVAWGWGEMGINYEGMGALQVGEGEEMSPNDQGKGTFGKATEIPDLWKWNG